MSSTQQTHPTTIEADPALPTVRIVRDFDAPPDRVFRAWTEKELVERWLGPKDTPMDLTEWDVRTGGSYRYTASRDGEVIASFYGSFHEVRPSERIVQTFTYWGSPTASRSRSSPSRTSATAAPGSARSRSSRRSRAAT